MPGYVTLAVWVAVVCSCAGVSTQGRVNVDTVLSWMPLNYIAILPRRSATGSDLLMIMSAATIWSFLVTPAFIDDADPPITNSNHSAVNLGILDLRIP